MAECVLAIDQGTTGTTVMVIDVSGRIRARTYGEVRQYYPHPGWVEHDADQIYRSVVKLGREALAKARVRASDLAGIGITNQRETFVVWERKTGRPIHRAIVWQCRRSADICEHLRDREDEVTARSGLLVDPYFSGTKLKWLLDQDRAMRKRARRGELCFGTIDTWLIYKLSRGVLYGDAPHALGSDADPGATTSDVTRIAHHAGGVAAYNDTEGHHQLKLGAQTDFLYGSTSFISYVRDDANGGID